MDTIIIGVSPNEFTGGTKILQINNDIPKVFSGDQYINFESIKDLIGAEVKLCTLINGEPDRCLGTFKLQSLGLGK
jgi:hypothetical protein